MQHFSYCLNGSTICTTPILTQIDVAAAAGYVAIELWHDKIDEYLDEGGKIADIRKALDDQGLAVPTTIYLPNWFDTTGDTYAAAIEECKRRMDQAVALGAPHIIAAPPGGRADYDLGARHYREILEIGCSLGVKPSMEFLGFVEQLNTIEDALDVINRSGHSEATTILDPFHIFRGGGSVESIRKLSAEQIAMSHFNDIPAQPSREEQGDEHRVMPGEGVFDLKRYLELLREVGYNRFLSLELFREELWGQDPYQVATRGLEKMREVAE